PALHGHAGSGSKPCAASSPQRHVELTQTGRWATAPGNNPKADLYILLVFLSPKTHDSTPPSLDCGSISRDRGGRGYMRPTGFPSDDVSPWSTNAHELAIAVQGLDGTDIKDRRSVWVGDGE
ncbi:MAG TPA: hypothetical protein VGR71_10675, partial [Nitrospira sp.]|nr:hypothetical protein [Nitrospira sp.]